MSNLADLITANAVFESVAVPTKKALLQQLGLMAADMYGLDGRDVTMRLTAREKLGSTGFGGGAAIPHARLPGLDAVRGVVVRLAATIDFGAIDGLPVDLVFMLISPVDAGTDHLKALARVSRCLRDAGLVAKLRGAGSRDALYALLVQDDARDAA
ncbi:PTS sugar transporter subunit IIA [uncultured Sphingomonas sp.]|uniref:PTS sugar transporter subunit IIA n=1 Tax=uncultured Sphingomonas sp. TaxID=158754 RepID=UPI0035CBF86D